VGSVTSNRADVRDFLVTRRAKITPQQAGLTIYGGNRRVPGLRREEVAMLAGVSADYYTRLEKGNLSGVSDTVLEAIAEALQLDEAYEEGALHEFAITFDPARPEGTNPQKQRQHFERCRALAQGEKISYLVTYAQSVSAVTQNKKEYEALLKEAASFDVDQPGARRHRLENVLAQRRAIWLLAHEDDVFTD